jgi:hypothetical protein
MVLTYDAYSETLESEKRKEDRVSVLEKQIQSLVSTLSKLTEQGQVNTIAQTLYSSGILREGKTSIFIHLELRYEVCILSCLLIVLRLKAGGTMILNVSLEFAKNFFGVRLSGMFRCRYDFITLVNYSWH